MSDFNPDAFMATEQSAGFDVKDIELPEGEYVGTIEDVEVSAISLKSGGEKLLMTVAWRIQDDEVCRLMANDNGIVARQKIWLNTVDGTVNSPLDRRTNQPLARLLEAIGLNDKPWSGSAMIQRSARVLAGSRAGEGEHEGRYFHEVKKAVRL